MSGFDEIMNLREAGILILPIHSDGTSDKNATKIFPLEYHQSGTVSIERINTTTVSAPVHAKQSLGFVCLRDFHVDLQRIMNNTNPVTFPT